jgi:aminoglycoside phosphotransferase family enzyme
MAEDVIQFQLPAPIRLGAAPTPGRPDERHEYSLSDMVAHFGRRAREYNENAEAARMYRRTQSAIDNPDKKNQVTLEREDLRVLKALAEAPRCGWAEAVVAFEEEVDDGKGGTRIRKGKRRVNLAAHVFLPLIDAIPAP